MKDNMHLLPTHSHRPRLSLFPPKALLSRAPADHLERRSATLSAHELRRIVSEMLG